MWTLPTTFSWNVDYSYNIQFSRGRVLTFLSKNQNKGRNKEFVEIKLEYLDKAVQVLLTTMLILLSATGITTDFNLRANLRNVVACLFFFKTLNRLLPSRIIEQTLLLFTVQVFPTSNSLHFTEPRLRVVLPFNGATLNTFLSLSLCIRLSLSLHIYTHTYV